MSDYNLKQSLSKIKAKPFNFALIEGKKSDMVLVTPKPAPGKLLDETKEECGAGKRVAKGICLRENGQIVFATRSAPMPAWKATLKKIFQEQKCSMFLPVELRQLGNHESDEVITEDTNEESSEDENKNESDNEPNNDQESADQSNPTSVAADSEQAAQSPTPQTNEPSQTQNTPPPVQPKQNQTTPPAPTQKPPAPQPQPQKNPEQPPTPPPLAPEVEAIFKKRYQNFVIAELKVPASLGQVKTQLKALLGAAKGLGDQHNFVDGNKKLDEFEKLLPKPSASNQPPPSAKGSMVTYIQAKLDWRNARTQVQAELQKVEQAVLDACKEQPNFGEIAGKVKNLYGILNTLDERLIDKLDDALKAQDPEKKNFADQQSRQLIKEYLNFINSDPLMSTIDGNPFAPVNVKNRLVATLTDLDAKIV
jgi:hypothetical protein